MPIYTWSCQLSECKRLTDSQLYNCEQSKSPNHLENISVWAAWTQEPEDLVYEDIDFHCDMKRLAYKQQQGGTESDKAVGKWGEQYVHSYLQKEMLKSDSNVVNVEWLHGDQEIGTPYEFIVTIKGKK